MVAVSLNNVRVKEGDEYLERVLFGYGQFGVITKARIKVRPYRPMQVRYVLYTDIGIALDVAKDLEVDTPFAALCRSIWSAAQADLGAGHDHTELAKYAAKTAGVNLG